MPAETTGTVHVRYHGFGRDEEEVEVDGETTFEDLLRQREIHPETALVFLDDEVVPAGKVVPPEGEVRVLHIVSGGGASAPPV